MSAAAGAIGMNAAPWALDATQEAGTRALTREIGARHGRLDKLVANAGKPSSMTTLTANEEDPSEHQRAPGRIPAKRLHADCPESPRSLKPVKRTPARGRGRRGFSGAQGDF
ncbi:MAG: hypothetical protein ACP5U2_05065 [Bryobacteraceae bacterium]